ncbi:MAG: hypothetical protein ACFFC7_22370 [Candidatus Hermodarchaeota archaeon]
MQSINMLMALIAILILMIEIGLFIILITGWYFGARRLNLKLHHGVVYGLIGVQLIITGLWMIPRALSFLPYLLPDITRNWPIILHISLGIITMSLGIFVIVIFLLNREIPLALLKKIQPVMVVVLGCWIITFALGATVYFLSYVF